MQKSQNGCKRNNLRAGEGKQLTVARTKQQEDEEDTGLRPAGRKNKETTTAHSTLRKALKYQVDQVPHTRYTLLLYHDRYKQVPGLTEHYALGSYSVLPFALVVRTGTVLCSAVMNADVRFICVFRSRFAPRPAARYARSGIKK